MWRELAAYPVELPDRTVAEEELAALNAMTVSGAPEAPRLHASLLLVAGALGSVSALAPALAEVRDCIGRFGALPGLPSPREPVDGPPGPTG
ncbi:DUF5955 family protein [Streptomyces sp. NPDC059740]|uniref:DUF5955 family protein n=1 Tax=Streptomyces sp. NPDC059740 TaxID=3346926 RepID=UPI003648C4F8